MAVLKFNMFEEDGHRIFAAASKYLLVKFQYLRDSKAGEAAWFVELMRICIGSVLFSFFNRYQECLEVGVENERHW